MLKRLFAMALIVALPVRAADVPGGLQAWEEDPARIFDASEVELDEFLWAARPLVVFANSERDPAFEDQMESIFAEIDLLVERRPGEEEDLVEDVRQRQQRRPDIEGEAVLLERREFPADHVVAFEQRDGMASGAQSDGCSEPTDATTDHHDTATHRSTLPRITLPAATAASGSIPSPPTVATSGSRKYRAKPSVCITDMYPY